MTRTGRALMLSLLMVGKRGWAQDSMVLEWSDHPADPTFVADAVFQRTLSCRKEAGRDVCELSVITIGRKFCPAVLQADGFRTESGNLKVTRTVKAVDLEFTDLSNTWNLHLNLKSAAGSSPIVDQASGVVATKAVLPTDRIRSTALIALVQGTEGFAGREFADVNLKCSKIAVVAAKRDAK